MWLHWGITTDPVRETQDHILSRQSPEIRHSGIDVFHVIELIVHDAPPKAYPGCSEDRANGTANGAV